MCSPSKEIRGAQMNENTFFTQICPKKYREVSLDSCEKIPKEYIEYGKIWAKKPVSIILIGNYGTGKTHFAFALIREMFRKYHRVMWPRYFSSTDFDSRLLNASRNEKGDQEEIDDRKKEDLLFIDDLGRETKSDRLKRQYFEIFNYRYAEELPTIISTNFRLDQLGEILDGALASRLQEWQMLEFKGPDLRQ